MLPDVYFFLSAVKIFFHFLYWMSNTTFKYITPYIFCNLHTTIAILVIDLMLKPLFCRHFSLLRIKRQILAFCLQSETHWQHFFSVDKQKRFEKVRPIEINFHFKRNYNFTWTLLFHGIPGNLYLQNNYRNYSKKLLFYSDYHWFFFVLVASNIV